MPYVTGPQGHRAHLEVVADGHVMRLGSRRLLVYDRVPTDADGHRYLYSGMILAEDSTATYYLPYTQEATYGTGTDTAVGILREFHDATFGDPVVDPIVHGKMIEKFCYEIGGTFGTVPAGVKTSLTQIEWV